MWREDKDAENGGKNNPEKPPRSKPIVLTTYPDIPLPLDGKINVPEPPSTEETNSSKPEGVSDSVQNDTLAANKTLTTNEEPEEEKEPIQVAYDEITARYPALYQYPPCDGVRASSSTVVAELMVRDAIDVAAVEQLAENCGETFCFSLVGEKIAPLCPDAI